MISIIESRGQGKTTKLCYMSAISRKPIIVAHQESKQFIVDRANELGLHIPRVYCISELASGHSKGDPELKDGVLIDELDGCMQAILGVSLDAFTLSPQVVTEFDKNRVDK